MTVSRETIETKPIVALREFFSKGSNREVKLTEFQEFWKSCSDTEREELRQAIKAWDGDSEYIKS